MFLCALAIEMETYAKISKKWKECSGVEFFTMEY